MPGRASEPSQSRVDDGDDLEYFLENMIGYRGFPRRSQFIGERATREDVGGRQVEPRCGQGVGRAWGRMAPVGPPTGVLLALSLFPPENNSRKFTANSEKLSRTTFLKEKDNRKQELALCILLIG